MAKITRNKHIGSDFDAFLCDESLLADVQATAIKRVLALQIETAMRAQGISKHELAQPARANRLHARTCKVRAAPRHTGNYF